MSGAFMYYPGANYGAYTYQRPLSDYIEASSENIASMEFIYGKASFNYPIAIGTGKDLLGKSISDPDAFGIIFNGYDDRRYVVDDQKIINVFTGGFYFDWSGA